MRSLARLTRWNILTIFLTLAHALLPLEEKIAWCEQLYQERQLPESGFSETSARFARTHARWKQGASVQLEDLLVGFADTIWKGKRDEVLEQAIAAQIASQCQEEVWAVYMKLDDIAGELAQDAPERILWQGKHPL